MKCAFPISSCLFLFLLLSGALVSSAHAQDYNDEVDKVLVHTAASWRAELRYEMPSEAPPLQPFELGARRSVPLAFGLSAAVPGLGQAYNRQWVKAAIGLATEVALVTGYTIWRGKGIDGRDAYQIYAHSYWSPVRYAEWLNDYKEYFAINANTIQVSDQLRTLDFSNPDSWTMEQQLAIRALFDQIRAVENVAFHPETGASFSHKLPFFGEQQYYELVGKYFQFAPGWEDYVYWRDANGDIIPAILDPERTGENGSKPNVSDRFFDYARDHGQANTYLRRASRLTAFFVMNHIIAAVDAAVFAKLHNNRLDATLQMGYDALGDPVPMASLRMRF